METAPQKIHLHKKTNTLEVVFNNTTYQLPVEYLRVYSPSAEVRGHGPGQETLQLNKENVHITQIEPVGNYAIKITYSDGHNSGIYQWDYLKELGANYGRLWEDYKEKVAEYLAKQAQGEVTPLKWVSDTHNQPD